jgi:hypothetical protein
MWKTMALCVSLFAAVIAALATSASHVRPGALALLATIGLSLVGAALIWVAPAHQSGAVRTLSLRDALSDTVGSRPPREVEPDASPPVDAVRS